MDQTWSNRNKLDRTWSNWIKLDQLGSTWLKLDQIGLNWIKLDQIGSNWIKLDQIVETWGWGLVPHPYLILCFVIFDYWKTWLKLVMLENFQACFVKISWRLKFSRTIELDSWNLETKNCGREISIEYLSCTGVSLMTLILLLYLCNNFCNHSTGVAVDNFWKINIYTLFM